jgi:hypothetical protein
VTLSGEKLQILVYWTMLPERRKQEKEDVLRFSLALRITNMHQLPTEPGNSKDDVAQRLANAHRAVEPSIREIFRVESPARENLPDEPIKLLEVNPNTTASGILPVGLSAHAPSGIFFPSVIIEIHPTEFELLQQQQLTLPFDWQIKQEL